MLKLISRFIIYAGGGGGVNISDLIGPKRDKGQKVQRNFRGHFKPELIKRSAENKTSAMPKKLRTSYKS
jgi:hypothetical protein